MRETLVTRFAVPATTALALAALAVPALLPRASGAGDGARVAATALVDSERGAVLLANITGAAEATKVTFTCRPRGSASTRTIGGVSSDIAAARIVGLDAGRVTRCTAKAGGSTRSIRPLEPGARAGGARLVGILGAVRSLPGRAARIDVALSATGVIEVETAGGRRLVRTGSRRAGVHRLRVENAPRGSIVVAKAVGRTDSAVVGGTLTATPTPTPTPAATATPTPTPAPVATPTPAPLPLASSLTISCPARVAAGQSIEVTGTLSPGSAGNAVVVRFIQPSGADTSKTVTTDAAGNFTAQEATNPSAPGGWNTQAIFAGSGALQPVQTSACQTTVG